ncbi:MAG: hypothetical protein DMF50_05515 [Acidobacteria bacterium]|nr:MAG: hypothetical protein DMF50_05515 [Acidobacteriota bacterium]
MDRGGDDPGQAHRQLRVRRPGQPAVAHPAGRDRAPPPESRGAHPRDRLHLRGPSPLHHALREPADGDDARLLAQGVDSRDRVLHEDIIHPDDLGKVIDLTEENARTRGFSTTEYRLLDRQGEVRWFRDEAVLMRDPAGEPVAWHGVMVEITGLKRMEQETIARPATMPGRRSSTDPPPA